MKYRKVVKFFKKPHLFTRDYLNKRFPIDRYELPLSAQNEQAVMDFCEFVEETTLNNGYDFPIDVVFTWAGTQGVEKAAQFLGSLGSQENLANYATDPMRFLDNNELQFAVNSVLCNMSWVRKIYIVSDDEVPDFIQKLSYNEQQKIQVIAHKQIIEEQYLPTFNSHVIEAHLHKIPDLSEHFIYFNDDIIPARPLRRTHFFQTNGLAILFASNKSLINIEKTYNDPKKAAGKTATMQANINVYRLLKQKYPQWAFDTLLVHSAKALTKSGFEQAWYLFENEIKAFLPNKFRSINDLNVAAFLVPHLLYAEKKALFWTELCDYFDIAIPMANTHYKNLLHKKHIGFKPHAICVNTYRSDNISPFFQKNLHEFLNTYFNVANEKL